MPRLTPEDIVSAAQKPLETAKILAQKALPAAPKELTKEDVKAARQYIKTFWKKLERSHPEDDESLIGLPHKYLVPAYEEHTNFDFNELPNIFPRRSTNTFTRFLKIINNKSKSKIRLKLTKPKKKIECTNGNFWLIEKRRISNQVKPK